MEALKFLRESSIVAIQSGVKSVSRKLLKCRKEMTNPNLRSITEWDTGKLNIREWSTVMNGKKFRASAAQIVIIHAEIQELILLETKRF